MTLCPYCGAYSPRKCELEEDVGCCPWEESGEYDDEKLMDEDQEP